MAMQQWSMQDTGMLITPYIAAYLNLYEGRKNELSENIQELVDNKTFDKGADDVDHEANFVMTIEGYFDMQLASEVLENLGIEYIYANEFTGTATCIHDPDQQTNFQDEYIVFVPTSKARSVFNDGYDSLDQVIAEFHEKFKDILPADFDYKTVIVNIIGTVVS